MDDIKGYVDKFATFGHPVEYKGLQLEPIVVRLYDRFEEIVGILQIEKNKIPDIDIIQMTYLEFLLSLVITDTDICDKFIEFCNLVFGVEYNESLLIKDDKFEPHDLVVETKSKNDQIIYINGWDIQIKLNGINSELIVCGHKINSKDFDIIRKIVLYQNIYDYEEEEMSDDFKRVIEQYYALRNKGMHTPTLEEKVMVVATTTAYKVEEIANMPIRSFEALFHTSVSKIDYIASKCLEPHLKDGHQIDHWVYYPEKSKYGGVFSDAKQLAQQITNL